MQPKRTKYKKYHKPRKFPQTATKSHGLAPPSALELIGLDAANIDGRQIEAARQTIRRKLKRRGRLLILISPDIGISKKSTAARMGKGKGKTCYWVCKLNPGKPIFRLVGVPTKDGFTALKAGSNKLPLRLKIKQK